MYIIEQFKSLQGEGMDAGTPAYFVRLAGCPVKCPFCDTKESWNLVSKATSDRDVYELGSDILANVKDNSILVITGGEPFFQFDELVKLFDLLYERKPMMRTCIETSASYLPENWRLLQKRQYAMMDNIWLNISPKVHARKTYSEFWKNIFSINEFRFAVAPEDGNELQTLAFVERFMKEYKELSVPILRKKIIISPILPNAKAKLNVKNMAWIQYVAKYCLDHDFRFSVQLHKLLGFK